MTNKIFSNTLLLLSLLNVYVAYSMEEEPIELERVVQKKQAQIPGSDILLDEHDLDQLSLLLKKAGMYALVGIAHRQITKHNDPSQSIKGKLTDGVTDLLIGAAITEGVPLVIGFTASQLHKLYLNMPIDYCRKKKKEFEHHNAMHDLKMQEAIQGKTKDKMQDALLKDATLLKKNEKQLKRMKRVIDAESDESEKNKLKEAYSTLNQQHLQATIHWSTLSSLSVSSLQPYATTIILETMRARQEANQQFMPA